MLKDITLGQFFPGNSIVHRLDPRLKLVLTFLFIVILFLCQGPIPYAIMTVLLIVAIALSKISFRLIFRSIRPILILLLITTIFNLFYIKGGTTLVNWSFLTVTTYGLYTAFFMVLRIILLIAGTFVMLTYTTSPIMLTDGLESLFSPLKRLHVPVHELSMMMTIALRFIPTLIEETDKILAAQKSRGADFESGNLFARARALVPILVPLFISAFRRAEDLATAMESRCYHGGAGRTRLRVLRLTPMDYWVLSVSLVIFALTIVVSYTVTFGLMLP